MDKLTEICEKKKAHVEYKKSLKTQQDLQYMVEDKPLPYGFLNALKLSTGPSLIAEIKKASPSKGVIREDFNPETIAKIYETSGAKCLSILTDVPYFQGNDDFLINVREVVSLPILRKDFMIDPYQIYESRALGADCILLIMAALSDSLAREMYEIALSLRMDILVEVHDLSEMERAIRLNPMMIGVNNRNLKTLKVDIQTSYDLLLKIPESVFKISESGIATHEDLKSLYKAGYQGFLVGESLMGQNDIGNAVHELLGNAL